MTKKTGVPAIRFKGFTDTWEQRKLGECVTITSGEAPSKFKHGSVNYVKVDDLNYAYKTVVDTQNKVSDNPSMSKVKVGSVIFPKRGAAILTNKVRILGVESYMDTNMMALTATSLDSDFLYVLISKEGLYKTADTSTIPQINNKHIEPYEVIVPTLDEQKCIGELFAHLDHLITLHQRKLEKLHNLKKAMLEKMFPKNGSAYPEIRFAGFTDAWEQRKFGDIADIKTGPFGSTLHAEDYVEDGTPIITTEHFKNGSLPNAKDNLPQVSDDDYKRLSSYILSEGDIVFSRVGSVDINAVTTRLQKGWLFSGRVLRARPNDSVDSIFMHALLETETVKKNIRDRAVGQTMPSINTEILGVTPLVFPQEVEEQTKIGKLFSDFDSLITLHQRKLEKLQNIKKSMLEKMFV